VAARTLVELFDERVSASGDSPALRHYRDSEWHYVSFADWYRQSTLVASALCAANVDSGERVAVLSRSRFEWVIADLGILLAGAVTVPVYPSSLGRQCTIIFEDAGVVCAIVEDREQLEKLLSVQEKLPHLRSIVLIDAVDADDAIARANDWLPDGCTVLAAAIEAGARALGADPNILQRRRRQLTQDTLASLVYTAGTTGRPRGVELTHGAFVAQVDSNRLAVPIDDSDELLLVLPLAQVFARVIYLTAMASGCVIAFGRGSRSLGDDLKEARPTLLVGVPQLFAMLFHGWRDRWGKGRLGERLVDSFRKTALQRARRERVTGFTGLQFAIANAAAFRTVRAMFGGRLRFAISGGAPMPTDLAEFFVGAGVPLLEGYGLTECCAAATVQRLDDNRIGTVGVPLHNVEVEIAEGGEVLLRGPTLMRGYWGLADDTAVALREGWLHTGDLGEWEDGHLKITGRIKDLIITNGGRNIAPMPIEAALEDCELIEYAVVCGDCRDYLTALIGLSDAGLRRWADQRKIQVEDLDELRGDPRAYSAVDDVVARWNVGAPPADAIRRFAILPSAMRMEAGELTETGKKRRRFLTRKYSSVLDALYGSDEDKAVKRSS
jgi:long-chain acyl-CoA synthetase